MSYTGPRVRSAQRSEWFRGEAKRVPSGSNWPAEGEREYGRKAYPLASSDPNS